MKITNTNTYLGKPVYDSVRNSVNGLHPSIRFSISESPYNSLYDSLYNSLYGSVWTSVYGPLKTLLNNTL